MHMVSCRVDALVVCDPGTYRLQTGQGPLGADPACKISHCKMLSQTTLATLHVVSCQPCSVSEPPTCSAHPVFQQAADSKHSGNSRSGAFPSPCSLCESPECYTLRDLPVECQQLCREEIGRSLQHPYKWLSPSVPMQTAEGGTTVNASMPFGSATCKPRFPEYLADLT